VNASFHAIIRECQYEFTYSLCADNSYNTGSTRNLEHRLAEHQSGLGGDYTSRRLPVKLVFLEEFRSLRIAFENERRIKGWRHEKKEALIRSDFESSGWRG